MAEINFFPDKDGRVFILVERRKGRIFLRPLVFEKAYDIIKERGREGIMPLLPREGMVKISDTEIIICI